MTDFPHLTSGHVGPVQADHMNRVFAAARRVLGDADQRAASDAEAPRGVWARLVEPTTFAGVQCWSWESRVKGLSGIETDADMIRSSQFGAVGGYAIERTGTAEAGDEAFVYPLPAKDGYAWYGAIRIAPAGEGTRVVRAPVAGTSGQAPPYGYAILVDGEAVEALNEYEEDPYGHGQPLSFSGLGSIQPGPVQGTVIAFLIDGEWWFDAQNPMVPACGGGG